MTKRKAKKAVKRRVKRAGLSLRDETTLRLLTGLHGRGTSRRPAKKNPGKTVRLKNFTGMVRLNPDKTVSVVGRKKKTAKKR